MELNVGSVSCHGSRLGKEKLLIYGDETGGHVKNHWLRMISHPI